MSQVWRMVNQSSKGILQKKKKNLRSGFYREELEEERSQLPVVWKQINSICLFEGTDYLPDTTSKIGQWKNYKI